MPGPPPNPNAVRRNPRVGLVVLPAGGRTGRAPKWPLQDNPRVTARIRLLEEELEQLEERELDEDLSRTERTKLTRLRERVETARIERDLIRDGEKALWRELWRTPQAVAWEQMKWTREVAQYVRHKAAAEAGSMDDSREARMRADALGLTPKGLKALMWQISTDEVGQRRADRGPVAATGTDGGTVAKRRIAAVDPQG